MSKSRRVPFSGAVADPQSYLNILYLLLGLPLGTAYFVILVTGVSAGFGLVVIWVGVPMLLLVFAFSWALCQFERILTIGLLKEDIPPATRSGQPEGGGPGLSPEERLFIGAWRRLKAHLSDRLTWTGMFYLLLRFPVGVATFTIAVILIAVAGALLGAPAYYWVDEGIELGIWQVDVLWEALLLTLAGVPSAFVALYLMNGMSYLSGRLARVMLGKLH